MPKKTEPDDDVADDVVDGVLEVLSAALPEEPATDADDSPIDPDLIFTTKPKPAADDDKVDDILEFEVDGVVMMARKPAKGAWTLIMSGLSKSASDADRTHGVLQFINSSLDGPSAMILQSRMLDRDDDFDLDQLADIVSKLVVKWSPRQSRMQRRAAMRNRR